LSREVCIPETTRQQETVNGKSVLTTFNVSSLFFPTISFAGLDVAQIVINLAGKIFSQTLGKL